MNTYSGWLDIRIIDDFFIRCRHTTMRMPGYRAQGMSEDTSIHLGGRWSHYSHRLPNTPVHLTDLTLKHT